MPIGYIVGKQYRIDTEYDTWAKLDVFSKIVRLAMDRGLAVENSYSHIGRNYSAEIKTLRRIGENFYTTSVALKNDASPLLAIVAALKSAFEKHPECDDILMRVLFMEAEAAELKLTVTRVVAAEKKQAEIEAKLAAAVHTLRKVIDGMKVAFVQNGEVISTATVGELRGKPLKLYPLPDFPGEDDDARVAAVNRPALALPHSRTLYVDDEDDDL